jgi:ribosomal protein S18 acetylase RimI-like enzyme
LHFQRLNLVNLDLLREFLELLGQGKDSFRYFEKRPLEIVNNHLYSWLLIDEDVPVAYGHLEEEKGVIWLGIAVAQKLTGHGYGKIMLEKLIQDAKDSGLSHVCLTVDKSNLRAISLYERYDFKRLEEFTSFYKYKLNLLEKK